MVVFDVSAVGESLIVVFCCGVWGTQCGCLETWWGRRGSGSLEKTAQGLAYEQTIFGLMKFLAM